MVTEAGMKKEIKSESLLDSNATLSSIKVEKKMQLNKQRRKRNQGKNQEFSKDHAGDSKHTLYPPNL